VVEARFGQLPARRRGPLRDRAGRPLPRGATPPLRRAGIAVHLKAKALDAPPRRLLEVLQTAAVTERRRAGVRANLGAIHRNLVQIDQAGRRQARHALRKDAVQQIPVRPAEVAQAVVVHRNTAAQPAIGCMAPAQPLQRPRRTDPLCRRIQPHRQKNPRVRNRSTGNLVARPDRRIEPRQIKTRNKGPDHPHQMIRLDLALQINLVPVKLLSIRTQNPRAVAHRYLQSSTTSENHNPPTAKIPKRERFTASQGRDDDVKWLL
jgi:hypothetical protein